MHLHNLLLVLLLWLLLLLLLLWWWWFGDSNSSSRVQQNRGALGHPLGTYLNTQIAYPTSYINLSQDLGVQHTQEFWSFGLQILWLQSLGALPLKRSPPNHDKWMKAATVQLRAQGPFIVVYPCQPCVFSHLLWKKVCAIWSRWGSAQHGGTQRSSRIPSISTSRSFWSTIPRCPRTAESLIITSWGFQVEILLV